MNTDTDYAWAAGFWDGEGNVSLTYRGAHNIPRIVVQIAQVHREVLDKFQRVVGYGNVLGPYNPRGANSQPYYVWRVEGVNHLHTIKTVLEPYLGSEKLNQMNLALEARRVWEETATCSKGHRLSQSSKGHWRCLPCQTEQGKKNAAMRWRGEEQTRKIVGGVMQKHNRQHEQMADLLPDTLRRNV